MASRHLDKLVRDFISGSSDPYRKFDPFNDLQDPTFLSFRLDFFPDGGLSLPSDAYSSGGLFRPSSDASSTITSYSFGDSAATYLAKIGAPSRQAALQQFKDMLLNIQNDAPWYFQSVSGLADIYKIDKSINFRGKDKVLTIDCLESIDMRMTMLGDLYRMVAFDFENWREVLPYNLRTFSMEVHVLEMRTFNTTYGLIADALASSPRPFTGEERQKELEKANRKNVYGTAPALFSGSFANIGNIASSVNSALGGLFTNLGQNAGNDIDTTMQSAFEAISIQTFRLRDCEFDFYSEAPSYLDSVTVKDATEASFKFKIHVGKIEKVGYYTFYDYVISEWTKNVRTPASLKLDEGTTYSPPYFERFDKKSIERGDQSSQYSTYRDYRESIFPTWRTQSDASAEAQKLSDDLRKKPLENALSSLIQAAVPYANAALNNALGNLTGGLLGTAPLGNVYGERSFIQRASQRLNDFLTPGNQLTFDQTSAGNPPSDKLGKTILTGASPTKDDLNDDNVFKGENSGKPIDSPVGSKILTGAETIEQNLQKSILTGASKVSDSLPKDILQGANSTGNVGDTNVFEGNSIPTPETLNENVYKDNPPPTIPGLGSDTNVFE